MDAWIDTHLDHLVAIRHDLHAHPELSGQERRTAGVVAAELKDMGIPIAEGIGGHGVVGTIRGRRSGPQRIGLRADMDALPIREATGLPHASTHPGRMHACGHDGHTTMLLGAARYLAEHPDFAGTVHVIFQPAEETLSGAAAMLADGLFQRFPCDAVYAMHNAPGLPVGHFSIRPGAMFAAADNWTALFRGRGGHAGVEPHLSQDVIHAQAQFITGLQGIVTRNVPPMDPVVLSVGHVAAGAADAPNIIPAELRLDGITRCYSPDVRSLLTRRLHELAAATAQAWGCTIQVTVRPCIGPLVNTEEQTRICIAAARELAGHDRVLTDMAPIAASEDFAAMLEACPGALMGIGNGAGPDGQVRALHTPLYDFNDDVIAHGVRYWVGLVRHQLGDAGS